MTMEKITQRLVTMELGELAMGLSEFAKCKGQLKIAKEFEKKAEIFKSFSRNKEVNTMGRKLTSKEKEKRIILRVIKRIKTIEKDYGIDLTKRACLRYSLQRAGEKKLEREIAERESELKKLKLKAESKL